MAANEQCQQILSGEGEGMIVDYFRKLYEQELERRVGAELVVKQMEAQARRVTTTTELAPVVVPVRVDVGVQTDPVTVLEGKEKVKKVVAGKGRKKAAGDGKRGQPSTSASARSRPAPESDDEITMTVREVLPKRKVGRPRKDRQGERQLSLRFKEEVGEASEEELTVVDDDEKVDLKFDTPASASSELRKSSRVREERRPYSPEPCQPQHLLSMKKEKEEVEPKATPSSCMMPMRRGILKNRTTTTTRTPTPKFPGHIRILTGAGEPPLYQCVPCGRKFGSTWSVSFHRFCGTGKQPFQCELCVKGYAFKSSLEAHLRSHTGERPYQCTHCAKRFSYKGHLSRHLISHTGGSALRRFRCQQCGERYTRKLFLERHLRTHSKAQERFWACHQCPKDFRSYKDLRRHRSRVHAAFKCWMCGCIFKSKELIEKHITTVHNQQPRQVVARNGGGETRTWPRTNAKECGDAQ